MAEREVNLTNEKQVSTSEKEERERWRESISEEERLIKEQKLGLQEERKQIEAEKTR